MKDHDPIVHAIAGTPDESEGTRLVNIACVSIGAALVFSGPLIWLVKWMVAA